MTPVYVTYTVTSPDGEDVELELAVEVSADGEVVGLQGVLYHVVHYEADVDRVDFVYATVPEWALRQIDMGDLAEDALRALRARGEGWP